MARDGPFPDQLIEPALIAVEIGSDEVAREWGAHVMLIARYIERIGDNTVDIGEQIAFVVSGEFREFTDASHSTTAPGRTR